MSPICILLSFVCLAMPGPAEIGKGMPIGAINCYFVVPGHSEIAATFSDKG